MDTKALRQKILDLAIRGKLVPQDPTDEPASVLLERIRAERQRLVKEGKLKAKDVKNDSIIYKDPSDNLHYEKFADGTIKCIEEQVLLDVPDTWAWTKINTIAFVTKLAGFEYTTYIAPNLCNNGIPLFKGKNIQDSQIIYKFESYIPEDISDELSRSQINRKCILTPYVGTIGNIGIHNQSGKFHLGSNVGKIELCNNNVVLMEEYVVAYLQSSFGYGQLTKHMKATAQASISIEAIRDVYIPIPPGNEQKRLCNEIQKVFLNIDKIIEEQNRITELITTTKSKILDLAIRGKLVPQDPDDEPASVLLERIKAEKEELIKQGKIKRDKAESTIFKGVDNSYYGYVPTNWTLCSLADIAEIELGKTLDTAKNTGTYRPYLRSLNIKWGAVDLTDIKQMRIEDTELQRYSIQKNDLLICEGGDVGRAYVWNKDINFCYQNAIHRVRFYKNCNPYYFYYVMVYLDSIGYLKEISTGVTIKHLTKNILIRIPFLLPPLAEQQRIVYAIETAFTELDKILADIA